MNDQALIIFAKLPRPGEVKTRLGEAIGIHAAAEIYRQFAEHAFRLGRQVLTTGRRVYVFHDQRVNTEEVRSWVGPVFHVLAQEGASLGDRMQNAFNRTFGKGAGRAVIIGTDVPELDLVTLEHAFDALSAHDVVIGPASDGGYYLLGMKAPTKELFDGIVWSSGMVLHDTHLRLRRLHLSFVQLQELADIDTVTDYNAYLERRNKKPHLQKRTEE